MRPALAAATLLAALAAGCGADPAPPQLTTTLVAGLSDAGDPTGAATDATTVAIDGVLLASPESLAAANPEVEALRATAQTGGRSTLLVVSNYVPDLGAYSGDLARAMLADPAARASVVSDVVAAARRFDGVQIDLSGLAATDSAALVDFVAALDDALPEEALLTLGMVASTDFGGYRERGYDVEALEPSVDRFVLQTFEPGGADVAPEPLGAGAGIAGEVDYLTSQIDASDIDLGITPSVGLTLSEATELARTSGLHGVVVAGNGLPTLSPAGR